MSKRKPRSIHIPDSYDELVRLVTEQQEMPFNLAVGKVQAFVNQCVQDKDFRASQSEALLELLLVMRDVLMDRATEEWTLDDYFAPIESAIKSRAASKKNVSLKEECRRAFLTARAANPKIKKINFALEVIAQNDKLPDDRKRNYPTAKRIAEVWLSDPELKDFQG